MLHIKMNYMFKYTDIISHLSILAININCGYYWSAFGMYYYIDDKPTCKINIGYYIFAKLYADVFYSYFLLKILFTIKNICLGRFISSREDIHTRTTISVARKHETVHG